MAHHSNLQHNIAQGATPGMPTGSMTPLPSFRPLQVPPPFVRHDPVPIGGPGSQYHIASQGRSIPSYTQFHGTPLHPQLANPQLQRTLFQHQGFQHAPHQEFQYGPLQRPPFQYGPLQRPPFQHGPLQHPPFQYAQFQRPDVSATHLQWGYTYPPPVPATAPPLVTASVPATALVPAPVPHQETMRPSGQASSVKKAVVEGKERSPAVVPAEATRRGRRYPNLLISNGGKSLLT